VVIDQLLILLVYFVIPWGALLCIGGWIVDRFDE
jgi:purine-cytosine permease-like protein